MDALPNNINMSGFSFCGKECKEVRTSYGYLNISLYGLINVCLFHLSILLQISMHELSTTYACALVYRMCVSRLLEFSFLGISAF